MAKRVTWVEEEIQKKSFTNAKAFSFLPDVNFYSIRAAGIDNIERPGRFTPRRFEGIRIEATGQNIITLGDGNQINVKFKGPAEAYFN
jgi:hypothetical protein